MTTAVRAEPTRAFVPTLVAIGLVVSIISSLGAPLVPTISTQLHTSIANAQWTLTAPLLVGAVASPLIGRLGDGPHRRTVLLANLAVVTIGGVIAALAGSLAVLVLGRALQGFGLALMPLTMASARDHLEAKKGRHIVALLSIVGAVGVGLGYPLTGLIAVRLTLSAAFWFGAAASGVMLVLAALFVPAPSPSARARRLDLKGALLIGGGILALLLALDSGDVRGWSSPTVLGLFAASVVLLVLWTVTELRVGEPLVDLRLMRRRGVLTADVSALLLGVAMFMTSSLMVQAVQLPTGLNESAFIAGMTLLPMSALSAVSNRLLPMLRRWSGPRGILVIGCTVMGAAMLFFGLTGGALWEAFVAMGVFGLGLGFTYAAMPALIVASVPVTETGSATSVYQISRYVGSAIGSGLAVALLRSFSGTDLPDRSGYAAVAQIGAILCLVTGILAWLLLRSTRLQASPAPTTETVQP